MLSFLFLMPIVMNGQDSLRLWSGEIPGALGEEDHDIPLLIHYSPSQANGTAVVICPGGGYSILAMGHEGHDVATWFAERGVHAFILTYRLGSNGYRHPVMMWDGLRAMKLARHTMNGLGYSEPPVGILGFSAGGHLAATVSTKFEEVLPAEADDLAEVSARPDFSILAYPVISMLHPVVHKGSRAQLMGENADDFDLQFLLSAEEQITASTPPAFLVHTDADQGVVPENSIWYYLALRRKGVPAELHIYQEGRHGLGMFPEENHAFAKWPAKLETWMQVNNWLPLSESSPDH